MSIRSCNVVTGDDTGYYKLICLFLLFISFDLRTCPVQDISRVIRNIKTDLFRCRYHRTILTRNHLHWRVPQSRNKTNVNIIIEVRACSHLKTFKTSLLRASNVFNFSMSSSGRVRCELLESAEGALKSKSDLRDLALGISKENPRSTSCFHSTSIRSIS